MRRAAWAAVWTFVWAMTASASVAVDVSVVDVLHPEEPYAPLVFHDGGLWVGTSRGDEGIEYRLRRYDARGDFQSEITLSHTIGTITPVGPNRVMVVGKSYGTEWRTHYSEVVLRGGALRASSYRFSRAYQVEEFAGDAKRWFFTEPGDRAVLEMGAFGPSKLPVAISAPGPMALVGNKLFVVERNAFRLGDENLVRIDLETKKAMRIFAEPRGGIVSLLPLAGGGRVAIAETLADRIVLVDSGIGRSVATIDLPGRHPRALAQRGRCLVVGSGAPAAPWVSFVDVSVTTPTLVAEWEPASLPAGFGSIHALAIDPASKRVFARSHEFCGGCSVSSNVVVRIDPPSVDPAAVCDR